MFGPEVSGLRGKASPCASWSRPGLFIRWEEKGVVWKSQDGLGTGSPIPRMEPWEIRPLILGCVLVQNLNSNSYQIALQSPPQPTKQARQKLLQTNKFLTMVGESKAHHSAPVLKGRDSEDVTNARIHNQGIPGDRAFETLKQLNL